MILHLEIIGESGASILNLTMRKGRALYLFILRKDGCAEPGKKSDRVARDSYTENVSMVLSSKSHEKRKDFLDKVTSDDFGDMVKEYFSSISVKKWGDGKV